MAVSARHWPILPILTKELYDSGKCDDTLGKYPDAHQPVGACQGS